MGDRSETRRDAEVSLDVFPSDHGASGSGLDAGRSLDAGATAEQEHGGAKLWALEATPAWCDCGANAVDAIVDDVPQEFDYCDARDEAERARRADLDDECHAEVWELRQHEVGQAGLWLIVVLGVVLPALLVAARGFGAVAAGLGAR